ncbi:hypothetical protein EJ04DRAFT_512744 [Polyplosphaeria fusca]|uniref:Secreted protein n=1 Tax=Polyplosphaeria fusca TaxID=682080 RepID=A0A9P4V3A2_9PLEO|nr:hypothetical protein EJ04DRAFT_512744 [Polyplosphaeria fusca]
MAQILSLLSACCCAAGRDTMALRYAPLYYSPMYTRIPLVAPPTLHLSPLCEPFLVSDLPCAVPPSSPLSASCRGMTRRSRQLPRGSSWKTISSALAHLGSERGRAVSRSNLPKAAAANPANPAPRRHHPCHPRAHPLSTLQLIHSLTLPSLDVGEP